MTWLNSRGWHARNQAPDASPNVAEPLQAAAAFVRPGGDPALTEVTNCDNPAGFSGGLYFLRANFEALRFPCGDVDPGRAPVTAHERGTAPGPRDAA